MSRSLKKGANKKSKKQGGKKANSTHRKQVKRTKRVHQVKRVYGGDNPLKRGIIQRLTTRAPDYSSVVGIRSLILAELDEFYKYIENPDASWKKRIFTKQSELYLSKYKRYQENIVNKFFTGEKSQKSLIDIEMAKNESEKNTYYRANGNLAGKYNNVEDLYTVGVIDKLHSGADSAEYADYLYFIAKYYSLDITDYDLSFYLANLYIEEANLDAKYFALLQSLHKIAYPDTEENDQIIAGEEFNITKYGIREVKEADKTFHEISQAAIAIPKIQQLIKGIQDNGKYNDKVKTYLVMTCYTIFLYFFVHTASAANPKFRSAYYTILENASKLDKTKYDYIWTTSNEDEFIGRYKGKDNGKFKFDNGTKVSLISSADTYLKVLKIPNLPTGYLYNLNLNVLHQYCQPSDPVKFEYKFNVNKNEQYYILADQTLSNCEFYINNNHSNIIKNIEYRRKFLDDASITPLESAVINQSYDSFKTSKLGKFEHMIKIDNEDKSPLPQIKGVKNSQGTNMKTIKYVFENATVTLVDLPENAAIEKILGFAISQVAIPNGKDEKYENIIMDIHDNNVDDLKDMLNPRRGRLPLNMVIEDVQKQQRQKKIDEDARKKEQELNAINTPVAGLPKTEKSDLTVTNVKQLPSLPIQRSDSMGSNISDESNTSTISSSNTVSGSVGYTEPVEESNAEPEPELDTKSSASNVQQKQSIFSSISNAARSAANAIKKIPLTAKAQDKVLGRKPGNSSNILGKF
jgi:hypothetical protein